MFKKNIILFFLICNNIFLCLNSRDYNNYLYDFKNLDYESINNLQYKSEISSVFMSLKGEKDQNIMMEVSKYTTKYIEFFLGLGIDINDTDIEGKDALYYAISGDRSSKSHYGESYDLYGIKYLLEHGAHVKDYHIERAHELGKEHVANFLVKFTKKKCKKSILDVAIGTKNRNDKFKRTIFNLNSLDGAESFSLYIMDGNSNNEIENFLSSREWRFNSIHICRDDEVESVRNNLGIWPVIYNHLFSLGSSEYITYWSDDILMTKMSGFRISIDYLSKNREYCSAIFPVVYNGSGVYQNNIYGVPLITFGVIRRSDFESVNGLDSKYKFYCADNDLSNKLYFTLNKKFAHICDYEVLTYDKSKYWKNVFSSEKYYSVDREIYNNTWGRASRDLFDSMFLKKV